MVPITEAVQKDFGMPDRDGAFVRAVNPNSPASQAKVEQGDVIRAVDGKPVKTAQDVVDAVRGKKIGQTVKIDVLRNNSVKKTLTMKIGAQPQGGAEG
jgi:S1-C subfamily serine protease